MSITEQRFGGDVQVRMKNHLPKESRRGTTGTESARENASTRVSAKRDASLGVEATLADREPHNHMSMESRRDHTGPESSRESARASARASTGRGGARESTSTRASAKNDASLGVEATLTDREPRDYLPTESRRDHTGPESSRKSARASSRASTGRGGARESTSTRSSAKRDASLGVEATRTDRELHENVAFENTTF